MALSYFTECEAPRDFRISSTESEGHYTKCILCYTVKKNFYCAECIKNGNFLHSSMPYSDRFSEKQAKLLRLKSNRKHVLDRCEKLLANKLKRDSMITEVKQSKDKIDLLKLAIEQRRGIIEERRKQLKELQQSNNELKIKLPRYQKRVASLGKHTHLQRVELEKKINLFNDKAQSLAALRRSRIRQLIKYIFPLYVTYDVSDSLEDMEFIGDEPAGETGGAGEAGGAARAQLHVGAPWLYLDADLRDLHVWVSQNKEGAGCAGEAGAGGAGREGAALAHCAQLVTLMAATTDTRLPAPLLINAASAAGGAGAGGAGGAGAGALAGGVWALCARAALAPPRAALPALQLLAAAAAADHPALGRVEGDVPELEGAWAAWSPPRTPEPPEHLSWPECEAAPEPPAGSGGAPSLARSAAASLASMWRGWTK